MSSPARPVSPVRAVFVDTAEIAWRLAALPEVAAAWHTESACAQLSVGGLAEHLTAQAVVTARLLTAAPEPDSETIPVQEHYQRAAWVSSGLDAEVNVAIRTTSDELAAAGPQAVLATSREALDRLPELLSAARDPDTVHLPWQGWSLRTDDFLTTRLMEIVVHADDLAASVGQETPKFPEDTVSAVLGLLTGIAVRRHGQAALVRALSRPQRAPASVSAF